MDVDLKKVGQWFRQAREDMNLSVREAAKLSGISANQVTRMENGFDFSMEMLARLAVPLGIPPASLIDGALTVGLTNKDPGARAAYEALQELDNLDKIAQSHGYAVTSLGLIDLMEMVGICACQLLLSANPRETLQNLAIPLPSLRRRLEGFIDAYGLETETSERAAVFRALITRPARKLRALGLLAEDVVKEYLTNEKTRSIDAHAQLTSNDGESIENAMPENSDIWLRLVERISKATSQRGDRARLARDLNVTRQAVSNWLSGASAPSAVITLHLLEWVSAEEAKKK